MTSTRDARRIGVTLVGVLLLFLALFGGTYALTHQLHQDHAGNVLLASQKANAKKVQSQGNGPCTVSNVKQGQLSGILSIPAINLQAPVEEGTDDPELNVAVGHAPASVWPGLPGTSVFLAHDVSYFVHLNALKAGDVITYATACNTWKYVVSDQQVVAAGSPVANTTSNTMVLDTCWPPNALFFTPDRLLIHATEVGAAAKGGSLNKDKEFIDTVQSTNFTTSAPPQLQAQGLTLDQNYAPMGTMNLVNASVSFAQSPGPLSLEAAALDTYFGGLHSGAQRNTQFWDAMAPTVPMPPQLDGASISDHESPLNVEIDSTKGVPSQVVLHETVTLSGGSDPGTYNETVVLPVHGSVVTIGSWTFS
ncbi:MAG TPA: class D sortase [Acidimicrobiales bacterium]|jgi:LPXTG-site transpeptidase (sortase) family protein